MSDYIYSPSKNCFFAGALKEKYVAANSWPEDGVVVENDIFIRFTGQPPAGKIRRAGKDGSPEWVDLPSPTQEEAMATADAAKQGYIDAANRYISEQQWPSKLMLGRLTENEETAFNRWLDYLDAVNAIDTSTAPEIKWPVSPLEN